MSSAWSNLEAAVEAHPDVSLRPPAPSDALQSASFEGCPRPVPVQEIWGVHDGSDGIVIRDLDMRLLGLAEALTVHRDMLQMVNDEHMHGQGVAKDGSKPEIFTAGWIPVAEEEEHLLCLDLDPTDPSKVGQLIIVHTTEGSHGRLAEDLPALWEHAATSLRENW